MTNQDWILTATEQAELFPPSVVAENPLPSIFTPVETTVAEHFLHEDYYFRSPIQRELFDLDPQGDPERSALFAKFSKPVGDFFARQLKRRIKSYGTQYATAWFKGQQAVLLTRFKMVMAQYADILSVLEIPQHNLDWVENLAFKPENWKTPKNETAAEFEARKQRRIAECQALFPSLVQRLENSRKRLQKNNLRPLCYLRREEVVQFADRICDKINDHASQRAAELGSQVATRKEAREVLRQIYSELVEICNAYHIAAPFAAEARKRSISDENLQTGLLKLVDPKFWSRKLLKMAKRQREHLSIAVGMVHAASGGYVSNERLKEYEQQRRANIEFIKSCVIVNTLNSEEQHDLLDIWLKSNANPKINRIELMTRLRGYEEWADREQHEGVFITLTAPSKYHAMLKQGGVNPKWNGAAPYDTQKYLCTVWRDIRAELSRLGIKQYGVRVAEPHHDATPHFHFVLWTRPEEMKALKRVFYKHALKEDGDEKGARLRRCRFMKIDKAKGSAVAYLAKYVSKNIDGKAMDDLFSDETGRKVQESAARAKAWATLWDIRQFQFFGGANIGSWRELRKLGDLKQEDPIIETGRAICDLGDFAAYMDFQGGALVKRNDQKIRLHYVETEPNKYLETRQKVMGVINTATGEATKTRLKEWTIGKKPKTIQDGLRQQDGADTKQAGLPALGLVSVTVRSTETEQISKEQRERIKNELITMRGRVTDYQIDDLLNGKPLKIYSNEQIGVYVRYSRGQLIEEKIPQTLLN